jgi:protein-L-isoaspartate(D-aspartate) O-methyltransferase
MSDPNLAVLRLNRVAQTVAHTIFLTARRGKVPRHDFVRLELQPFANEDRPLPSGYAKTISPPFIVALMTDLLGLRVGNTVLEVGTGLGPGLHPWRTTCHTGSPMNRWPLATTRASGTPSR